MQTVKVTENNTSQFIDYCRRYGKEHDDSFLPDEQFVSDDSYPAYLLLSANDVIGAVCLIRTKLYVDLNRGRFMIFHSVKRVIESYSKMLNQILTHAYDLSYLYLFIPEFKSNTRNIWEKLGFAIERYSFILKL